MRMASPPRATRAALHGARRELGALERRERLGLAAVTGAVAAGRRNVDHGGSRRGAGQRGPAEGKVGAGAAAGHVGRARGIAGAAELERIVHGAALGPP